jgi:hypothetical protein
MGGGGESWHNFEVQEQNCEAAGMTLSLVVAGNKIINTYYTCLALRLFFCVEVIAV